MRLPRCYATYDACHRDKTELILVLEIADDVVDKNPWIKGGDLRRVLFHVLDSASLLSVSPRPYR
jgi:hypothetical protein